MKPEQIRRLDPHYAHEMEFAVDGAMRAVHDATVRLNDILAAQGQPVDVNARLHHIASHVFYARSDGGWPLDISIEPQRVTEVTPYEEMAKEMQTAIDVLA